MPISHAIILGIVQGLTEVLPISSSAHLVILPWIFKWHYQGLSFDIALHIGTTLAFIAYFFKDWLGIIAAAFTKDLKRKNNLLWLIVIGTIPAAIAGLILEKQIETSFRSPLLIAAMLFIFAIVIYLADRFGSKQKSIERIDFPTALTIGLTQILALIPGVSRSGITISAGLFKGFSREASARFSFLLATPIVVGAGILELRKMHSSDLNMAFLMGVLFSALSGFIAIHFLLRLVKRFSLNIFVFYRILLAAAILIMFLTR